MRSDNYGGSAGKSSAKESPKYKEGSLDALQNRKGYKKDMYDRLASAPKNPSASGKPNTGIQGSGGPTQNKNQNITVSDNNGSADYGKGNPFQKHKQKEPKVFKSIQELREYGKQKGYT